ncbi:MAG: PEP/pyruvate-binding domain-containing protein [Polyangiales bacterium]
MTAQARFFGPLLDDDDADPTQESLGGKGFGLSVMVRRGFAVPPGFTLDTGFTAALRARGGALDEESRGVIEAALARLAAVPGGPRRVSVRASPVHSMPGMLDTVLDLADSEVPDAVERVLASWDRERARRWREEFSIPDVAPAIVVQRMVYGDRGAASGTGVAYSRDPRTGEPRITGEFLALARGPELVGGRRGGISLSVDPLEPEAPSFARLFPELYAALASDVLQLESHFGQVPNVEFTVEEGTLWFLQTRPAALTLRAAARVTRELVQRGFLSPEEALRRIDPWALLQRMHRRTDPDEALVAEKAGRLIATGLPASPGHATGVLVLDPDEAVTRAQRGEAVILVRRESLAEDVAGIRAAEGVLTTAGGLTSHAAVVARSLGRCCITACTSLELDLNAQVIRTRAAPRRTIPSGAVITLDGTRGRVFEGSLRSRSVLNDPDLTELLRIADSRRSTRVYALVSSRAELATATELGADGAILVLDALDAEALGGLIAELGEGATTPRVLLPRGVTRRELESLKSTRAFTSVISWPDLPGDARLVADSVLFDRCPSGLEADVLCGVRVGNVSPVETLRAARALGVGFVACAPELAPTARWALAQ